MDGGVGVWGSFRWVEERRFGFLDSGGWGLEWVGG